MDTKPLLSDQIIDNVVATSQDKEEVGRRLSSWFRELTKDDRAEDARLIQQLVNALKIHDEARTVMTRQDINLFRVKYDIQEGRVSDWLRERMDNALSAAAARNFKPSQP